MVFKRYIKRGRKTYGPYYYKSYRDKNGVVRKKYIGTDEVIEEKYVKTEKTIKKKHFTPLKNSKNFLKLFGLSFFLY